MNLHVRLYEAFRKLMKYLASTLLGTATDTLVLWVMSHLVFSPDNYLGSVIISPMISFECAVMVNYCSAFFFVWRDRLTQRTARAYFSHLWKFNLSCVLSFFVKMCLLVPIQLLTGWDVVICNLLALMLSGLVNFTLNEFVIFRKK